MRRKKDDLSIKEIYTAIRNGQVEWQRHALERMAERAIRRADARNILLQGKPIESYPDDRPFPSVLFLGWIGPRPLHVVADFDSKSKTVFIITAYEPNSEYFESDFKTRRKP